MDNLVGSGEKDYRLRSLKRVGDQSQVQYGGDSDGGKGVCRQVDYPFSILVSMTDDIFLQKYTYL